MDHDRPCPITQFWFYLLGSTSNYLCRLFAGVRRETPAEFLAVRTDQGDSIAATKISHDFDKADWQKTVAICERGRCPRIQSQFAADLENAGEPLLAGSGWRSLRIENRTLATTRQGIQWPFDGTARNNC